MNMQEGMQAQLHEFLNSTPDGGEQSATRSLRFTHVEKGSHNHGAARTCRAF